jgi:hypothetical protein
MIQVPRFVSQFRNLSIPLSLNLPRALLRLLQVFRHGVVVLHLVPVTVGIKLMRAFSPSAAVFVEHLAGSKNLL